MRRLLALAALTGLLLTAPPPILAQAPPKAAAGALSNRTEVPGDGANRQTGRVTGMTTPQRAT